MKRLTKITSATVLIVAIAITLFSSGCSTKAKQNETVKVAGISDSEIDLKMNMRKLWQDHILWTRNVIFCLVDKLPGTEQAIKRQLQNQVDLGNVIKPYYGDDAGNKLTELLNAHINISVEVIKAAKEGKTKILEVENKKWYANADEIAEFFSKSNPNLPLAEMKMMMSNHLKLTTDEVEQRIKKNYNADVVAYDKIHYEILRMADTFSKGIINQFPEKFETDVILAESK